jgi:Holliday junction resolvasome RuvABC ATP-dependent DNA helicase subunit
MDGIPASTLQSIAERSRGTPRVALRLLRRVRDFSAVRAAGRLDTRVVDDALALEDDKDLVVLLSDEDLVLDEVERLLGDFLWGFGQLDVVEGGQLGEGGGKASA